MIEIKKEELLKVTPDYEEYSENVCNLSIEELKELGLLKCGGCCTKNTKSSDCSTCNGCKSKTCSKHKL
ncbi:hypothetical protein FDB55_04485 [Clostridium botulinum]|uniref:Uncharacterized protein n=1 Tax=Clostridium botulinum TaxID=1491 RepID=A0A0C2SEN3_CLOBO|nr:MULTISPECIES: hypothetical protein [Clostridium]ACD52255.1 hypothetical protein CLH_2621 [Clostridium botulinum E3 str. Alaska E43]AJF30455.1 hypothetical protein ST13_12345 [Clostridium botulinum]AJF33518.1 hypothetical protein ST12_12345 [Clostridium botulinum]KAI3346649.1 hypothetical protein CIT18_13710 [Clostridium botulinum]KIL07696.1 hypothetical protein SR42_01210 [Clostridium botulinum]